MWARNSNSRLERVVEENPFAIDTSSESTMEPILEEVNNGIPNTNGHFNHTPPQNQQQNV